MIEYKTYTTLADTLAQIHEQDLIQLEAYGDVYEDARWGAGEIARHYIDEENLPYNHVCAIVAQRVGCSAVSVKNWLACSRFYFEHPELEKAYRAWVRHSVMSHAAKRTDFKKVLAYAQKNNCSLDEIKALYPISEKPEPESTEPSIFGIEFKALKRWGYRLVGESKKEQFEVLLNEFTTKLEELLKE